MKIDVVLYGKLRERAESFDDTTGSIGSVKMKVEEDSSITDVMARLDIQENEVSHIFLNREYSDVERKVEDGDRLALFPRDMALLYKWYFTRKK